MPTVEVFGRFDDKLEASVFVSRIQNALAAVEKMAAIHAAKQQTSPETDVRDIQEAIKLYKYLIANPVNFKQKNVNSMLAALPISLAAKPVMVDKDIAVHLGISYTFKDYSDVVPKKVADSFKVVPVQVFKTTKDDPWRDRIVTKVKFKEISLDGAEFKPGVYTKCVGIALVWGGKVTPCPHEDQVRILDQPRHRCDHCTKAFAKARAKMRKSGRVPESKAVVDGLISLLD